MGAGFVCDCLECNKKFHVSQGGGFVFLQWCCGECGKTISLPRYAPRKNEKERKKLGLMHLLVKKIKQKLNKFSRFSRLLIIENSKVASPDKLESFTYENIKLILSDRKYWCSAGDEWNEFEKKQIKLILGPCECGGSWVNPQEKKYQRAEDTNGPHLLHRCPQCRSIKFTYQHDMSFD
jgi:hypothetical protein